jgi:glutamate---cysteine ligase / carboxylate-amine ligase
MSLHLFEAVGIELEYMIVDQRDLSVRPLADRLLVNDQGLPEMEMEHGEVAWSNELALHVIELKTNGPAPGLDGLADELGRNVDAINRRLTPLGAMLMPTAMHPWMDPHAELCLWPHDSDIIYKTFDRVFDCRGHGWANLQSTHINLPFTGDDELARLHAAIRLILPILPALAASSPIADGAFTGALDTRVRVYAGNARKVPSVTGAVIPESISSRAEYERDILGQIYADLAPHDPEAILQHEWVNSRGAIARFDRGSIEIRLLDVQECPRADIAVCAAVISAVRALVDQRLCDLRAQQDLTLAPLVAILDRCVTMGDRAELGRDEGELGYLELLGQRGPCTASELWQSLIATTLAGQPGADAWTPALEVIAAQGCLARRIQTAVAARCSDVAAMEARCDAAAPEREVLAAVYGELCQCLARNQMFTPASAGRTA